MKRLLIIGIIIFVFIGCTGHHSGTHLVEHIAADIVSDITQEIVHEVVGDSLLGNVGAIALIIGLILIL